MEMPGSIVCLAYGSPMLSLLVLEHRRCKISYMSMEMPGSIVCLAYGFLARENAGHEKTNLNAFLCSCVGTLVTISV